VLGVQDSGLRFEIKGLRFGEEACREVKALVLVGSRAFKFKFWGFKVLDALSCTV
jgi:hypothetical protein